MKNKTYHKKKILVVFTCAFLILTGLIGRLVYLMVFDAEYYQKRAEDLHKRERKIKAARGEIVDRNGVVLATNKTVCTIFCDPQSDQGTGTGDGNSRKRA